MQFFPASFARSFPHRIFIHIDHDKGEQLIGVCFSFFLSDASYELYKSMASAVSIDNEIPLLIPYDESNDQSDDDLPELEEIAQEPCCRRSGICYPPIRSKM
ncbi:hypothetical protein C8R43DRAFT_1116082 [Mycena crocata]|nr:hypothetical protein C8R43DRAFT_1116082 [Mycena crocata]